MPKSMSKPPTLDEVLDLLREIAPLELAAPWDNVGLLLAPARARRQPCARVLLTIDSTPAVVAEAARLRADLLVSYHPPIFQPLRHLDGDDPARASLLLAMAQRLAIYSPHTALDAAPGGLADWLAEGVAGGQLPDSLHPCGDGDFGRVVELAKAVPLATVLQRCKRRLGVQHVRVAQPDAGGRRGVRRIAVAAGAGGSVLRGVAADVFVTGEMSHHDVLAAVQSGTAVILAEHSNTERGYLPVLQQRLRQVFGPDLQVVVSKRDRDPLAIA